MKNISLIILSFLLALVGGTGAYVLSPLFFNLILLASLIAFSWAQLQRDKQTGEWLNKFDINKTIVFNIYVCFLLAYFLREVRDYSEFRFLAHGGSEGTIRQYTDLFRGFVIFLLAGVTYDAVNKSKILGILPILCLSILLIGLFLEAYKLIDFNDDIHEVDKWDVAGEHKLLERPGGFLNPNMTAALSLIWLFVALESKISPSIVLKGLALILALTICLISQSRAAILFLAIYAAYKLIQLRNLSFLVSLILIGSCLILVLYYAAPEADFATQLLEKFSARADAKEESANLRLSLVTYAFSSFQEAPVFGNGIFFVAKTQGHGDSSHNQTLEVLTNFGLVGILMMSAFYLTFYHKNSISYLSLCILPTLLFSHDFFDTIGFQVALGFAYRTVVEETVTKARQT